MIFALVFLCCSCGGVSDLPGDASPDVPEVATTGPLAGHALVGRWRRTYVRGDTEDLAIGADGSLLATTRATDAETGCLLVTSAAFTVSVTGATTGSLARRAGPYQRVLTETCSGRAPQTTTRTLNFRGTPETYSVEGAALTLSTATYQRAQ